jgi:NADPH-dependent 2,4-dienoyl-CoA reductase/sulfur reductase-like enzyme
VEEKIVIVGGGLAAARVVRAYRAAGGEGELTMVSADRRLPYNRPPLSKGFLRGELDEASVFVEPDDAYRELGVDVRLGAAVTSADTDARRVRVADGSELPYDALVLASGSLPRPLGLPGEELEGVHAYRTLDDAAAVRTAAATARRALIVGAGFIGMETAASLRRLGLEVTLIEPGERLFGALGNPTVSSALEQLYRSRGIELVLGDVVEAFHGTGGRLTGATTREGRSLAADIAIVGVGVQPSTAYLEGTGIELERGSVVVNERFESNVPGVYAVGDLASFFDPITGRRRLIQHWTNASYQGERLGRALAGEEAPYDQVAYFFTEVFGTKLGLLGDPGAHDRQITSGTLGGPLVGFYLTGDRLVAALISGQTPELQAELTELLRRGARLRDAAAANDPVPSLAAAFERGPEQRSERRHAIGLSTAS